MSDEWKPLREVPWQTGQRGVHAADGSGRSVCRALLTMSDVDWDSVSEVIADAPAMLDWLRTLTQDGPPRCICPANDCIHTQAYYTVRMWLLDKHGRGP